MIYLTITSNTENSETENFVVSKKVYNSLFSLRNWGGFKRFSIDIINDKYANIKVNYQGLLEFLVINIFPAPDNNYDKQEKKIKQLLNV